MTNAVGCCGVAVKVAVAQREMERERNGVAGAASGRAVMCGRLTREASVPVACINMPIRL